MSLPTLKHPQSISESISLPYVQAVDYTSENALNELAQSLHTTGFAVLKNHNVDQELLKNVLNEWKAFFDRQDKKRYLFDKKYFAGYYPAGSENAKGAYEKNAMEYFHHYVSFDLPNGMTTKTNELYWQLANLSKEILVGLEEALPKEVRDALPGHLADILSLDKPHTLMRVIHYPLVQKGDEGQQRNSEHEDIDLLTLLCSATAPGLQVKDIHGGWHDVGYATEDIVINTGDMLQLLTSGYYPSTTHRVVNPKDKKAEASRYSIPLFIHPRRDVELKKGFTAEDFLVQRLHETGILADETGEAAV